MKRQQVIIKIETPCNQQWSEMKQNTNGKFCSQCSKTVVDFTQLADREVIRIVNQEQSQLCGRLTSQQLNRTIKAKQESNYSRFYRVAVSLLFIGATKSSEATIRHEKVHYTVHDRLREHNPQPETGISVSDSLKNNLQGKVVDGITKNQ